VEAETPQIPGQLQLFNPGKRVDPWRNHPDTWVQNPDVQYHSSNDPTLPRVDMPSRGQGGSSDGFGGGEWSGHGIHMGTVAAAFERDPTREYIHSGRLNTTQFPTMGGKMVWGDEAANTSERATDAVRSGHAIAYKNDVEDPGSISYRVKPEKVKTWSEDVLEDDAAHPALRYLAEKGFNPTINPMDIKIATRNEQVGRGETPPLPMEGLPPEPSVDRNKGYVNIDTFSKVARRTRPRLERNRPS
jgi:hypothetical protein